MDYFFFRTFDILLYMALTINNWGLRLQGIHKDIMDTICILVALCAAFRVPFVEIEMSQSRIKVAAHFRSLVYV
ncbi:MAG: hypothetical protein AAGA77_09820 [Bacteroidota bacterium]